MEFDIADQKDGVSYTENAFSPAPIVDPDAELIRQLEVDYPPTPAAVDFASLAQAVEGRELEFLMFDPDGYAALESAMGAEWARATRQRIEAQRPAYIEAHMAEYRRLLWAQISPDFPNGDGRMIEPEPRAELITTGGEK